MITPIKDETKVGGCSNALIDIVPEGLVLDSFMFYDGKLELDLASTKVFVKAHTISKPVYYFWECLKRDPARLCEITKALASKFSTEAEFSVLQERWYLNENPFMVASTFFLLNRCSSNGLISSGVLEPSRYNPVALSRLSKFEFPENFHLSYERRDPLEAITQSRSDCVFVPAGKFTYNLFDYGKNIAVEETPINHRGLASLMNGGAKKIVATYDYHPAIKTTFNKCNLYFVNEYGKITNNEETAKEVIVANF